MAFIAAQYSLLQAPQKLYSARQPTRQSDGLRGFSGARPTHTTLRSVRSPRQRAVQRAGAALTKLKFWLRRAGELCRTTADRPFGRVEGRYSSVLKCYWAVYPRRGPRSARAADSVTVRPRGVLGMVIWRSISSLTGVESTRGSDRTASEREMGERADLRADLGRWTRGGTRGIFCSESGGCT